MTLSYDYARCTTPDCPLAETCRRKDRGRPGGWQTFSAYPGTHDCHGYIERIEDDGA